MKGGVCIFLVAAVVLANGLPQDLRRRKLSRQEVTAVAGDVVESSLTPEVGSLAPVGDVIENKPTTTTTVRTIIEGEVLSTPIPSEDGKAPAPVVVIPGVNVTGLTLEPTQAPFPSRVTTTVAPPTTTTVKPDEEDSSSEEDEDGDDLGGPQTFGGEDADDDNDDESGEEEEEEDEEARKGIVVKTAPVAAVAAAPAAAVVPAVPAPAVAPKRTNSKARDEPFSLEISTDMSDFQDSPPGPHRGQKYDAFIPGYMTEAGEIFVPIDTTDLRGPISIVDDPGMRSYSPKRVVVPKRSERKQVPQKALYDDDDDDDADDDEDTETSSQEDDDDEESIPVRLSSFNIIYKKKKNSNKKREQEAEEENDESEEKVEEKAEEVTDGTDSVEPEVQPNLPTAQVVVDSSGSEEKVITRPQNGLFINAAQGVKTSGGETGRPPSLAYVPASLPTGEDDENEFARLLSEKLVPVYETEDSSYEYLPRADFLPYFVPEKAHRRSFRNYYVPSFNPYNYFLH